ncbi:tetratricopeptide repeat protein [bacterium]|nr:tetratricopeptide repeat protein [bacterium]
MRRRTTQRILLPVILALFLGGTLPVNAQSLIDSLKQKFAEAETDSTRAALCSLISQAYQADHRNMETISWNERRAEFELASGQKKKAAHTMRVLGGQWWMLMDNRIRAMEHYDRSLRLYEEINDTTGLVWLHCNIGQLYMSSTGEFEQPLRYYQRAYDLADAAGNINMMATALWHIGVAYDFMGEKEEGITYLRRCLELQEKIGNPRSIQFTLVILAAICTNGGHFNESLSYLARSGAIADSLGDKKRIAQNIHSVGRIYRDQGDLVTAIDYEQRALKVYKEINEMRQMSFTQYLLANLYSRLGKADSSMHHFNAALEVSQRLGTKGYLRHHYRELAKHHVRMGNYKEAIAFQRKRMALFDSRDDEKSIRRINELTAVYEAERRERIIALLAAEQRIDSLELLQRNQALTWQRMKLLQRQQGKKLLEQDRALQQLQLARAADTLNMRAEAIALGHAENAAQRRKLALQEASLARGALHRNTLLGGFVVALLLTLLFLRILRNRRITAELRTEATELRVSAVEAMAAKQLVEIAHREHEMQRRFTTRLIASQEQERKRIAGALHDGVGQDLLIIKHRALMALDDAEQRKQHLGDITHIAVEAVEDVRRLCRDLSPYQLERVGLTSTLRDMLTSVEKSTAITMHIDIGEVDGLIPNEREIDLYRVVQEGMNNIVKHAEARKVDVTLQRVNGSLRLRIHDDGKGFELEKRSDPAAHAGLGMQSMAERMHLLDGEIKFESGTGNGTLIEALIPLPADAIQQQEGSA